MNPKTPAFLALIALVPTIIYSVSGDTLAIFAGLCVAIISLSLYLMLKEEAH